MSDAEKMALIQYHLDRAQSLMYELTDKAKEKLPSQITPNLAGGPGEE